MSRCLSTTALLLFSSLSAGGVAYAQTQHAVNMAIGEPGSESFVFGTELWAMSQIALKPEHGIDLSVIEVADESERLALLHEAEVDVALIGGTVPMSHAKQMRTVMSLWPEGTFSSEMQPAQILARKDVSDDVVYRITKAIFDNPNFFRNTKDTTFGVANRHRAIVGADLPIHPGASRYYDEEHVGFNSGSIGLAAGITAKAGKPGQEHPSTFAHFDDTALDEEERSQVAAACRQALELGALSVVLGDLSSRGCEVYQSYMEDRHNDHLQENDDHDLFAQPAGQGGPAVALDDVEGSDHLPILVQDPDSLDVNPRQPTM